MKTKISNFTATTALLLLCACPSIASTWSCTVNCGRYSFSGPYYTTASASSETAADALNQAEGACRAKWSQSKYSNIEINMVFGNAVALKNRTEALPPSVQNDCVRD